MQSNPWQLMPVRGEREREPSVLSDKQGSRCGRFPALFLLVVLLLTLSVIAFFGLTLSVASDHTMTDSCSASNSRRMKLGLGSGYDGGGAHNDQSGVYFDARVCVWGCGEVWEGRELGSGGRGRRSGIKSHIVLFMSLSMRPSSGWMPSCAKDQRVLHTPAGLKSSSV